MIFDLNGNSLTNASISIEANTVKIFNVKIECRNGFSLFASDVENLSVEARLDGTNNWTNLEDDSFPLSAFAGQIKTFEIRLTSNEISGDVNFALSVAVL